MILRGRLRKSDRGAVAIEYAIIGALIGIGLVGSLVGTKGSLSMIFGKASTGMSQSTASHPTPPASTQASYWAAKTLVSMTPSNVTPTGGTYTFSYSDNTVVTYSVAWKADGSFNGEYVSIGRNVGGYGGTLDTLNVNAAGQATSITHTSYYDATTTPYTISSASGAPTDGDWPGTMNFYLRDGSFSNRCSSGQCYDPTTSTRAAAAQDPLYFRGLVSQM